MPTQGTCLAEGTLAALRRLSANAAMRAVAILALAWVLQAGASVAYAACTAAGSADELAAQPCLTTLVQTDIASGIYAFTPLDLASAEANDAAWATLLKTCGPSGSGCTGSQLLLFNRLRNLEDNADELLGFGQTAFSIHLPAQLLSFALRWTADEEYSAQSSLASRFASNQFAGVSSRLSALRFIAQTQHFARADSSGEDTYVADASTSSGSALGGGAGADDPMAIGKWSLYANGVYDAGSKEPTTFNDAFSFAGTTALVGADIRLSRTLVIGLLASDIQQHADFDSSESIVSGTVKGSGGGITAYVDKDIGNAYLNFSLGGQRISLDTRRVVTYGSNNPQVSFVNTTLTSSTNATSLMATAGGGYTFYLSSFSATPYLNWQYLRTHIAGFQESATAGSTDPEFATTVNGQLVTSLISIAGVKLQYAWSLPFGVLLPYVYGEYRREYKDHSQNVDSSYTTTANQFQLPTDSIDPNYYEVGGGLMGVLARRTQIYVQYMRILQLQYYSDYGISGGIRFQF